MTPRRVSVKHARGAPVRTHGPSLYDDLLIDEITLAGHRPGDPELERRARLEVAERQRAGEPWSDAMGWHLMRHFPADVYDVAVSSPAAGAQRGRLIHTRGVWWLDLGESA